MVDLSGKLAIITGAGAGIGAATTELFAASGATVVAVDISAERLAQFDEIEKVQTLAIDLTQADAADRIFEKAAELGIVSVLVNNAGIMDKNYPVGSVPDDMWEKVMALNVTAPMKLMRKAVGIMREAGDGAIINVGSSASLIGGAAGAAYTASKHALAGLTKNTAAFYGPVGIRSMLVCPGGVKTAIHETGLTEAADPELYQNLLGGFGRTMRNADSQDLAALIAFLASAGAANMNGSVINSDGGFTTV